jgi:hypothetical protein
MSYVVWMSWWNKPVAHVKHGPGNGQRESTLPVLISYLIVCAYTLRTVSEVAWGYCLHGTVPSLSSCWQLFRRSRIFPFLWNPKVHHLQHQTRHATVFTICLVITYILILFFHLCLVFPGVLYTRGFPTKTLYEFLVFLMREPVPFISTLLT